MSRPFQETDTSNPTYVLKSKLTDTVNLKKLQFTHKIYFTNASLKRVLSLLLSECTVKRKDYRVEILSKGGKHHPDIRKQIPATWGLTYFGVLPW